MNVECWVTIDVSIKMVNKLYLINLIYLTLAIYKAILLYNNNNDDVAVQKHVYNNNI
jgi:hypothetical protein